MACIKCGKDTVGNAEFCEECLTEMACYPVKPGAPVILPKREEHPIVKHSRKKTVKPEAQVVNLKRTVRWLLVLTTILLLLVAAAAVLILRLMDENTATSLLAEYCFT